MNTGEYSCHPLQFVYNQEYLVPRAGGRRRHSHQTICIGDSPRRPLAFRTTMNLEENKNLAPLTTMRVGGPARFFSVVSNDTDLVAAVRFAEEKGAPLFVLGEGSNILVADRGVSGLVLKFGAAKISLEDYPDGHALLIADAGARWDTLVGEAVLKKLYGIENLSLIPGTAGAAPVQNIGAYGAELADTFLWAEAFDARAKKPVRLGKDECDFGYRDSIFKKKDGDSFIITRIALLLKKDGAVNADYKDTRDYFKTRAITNPTLEDVRRAIMDIRIAKLPDREKIGTVGSFFKNPVMTKEQYDALAARYPELPAFPQKDGRVKIQLAWVLDKVCGMKGVRRGAVGTHEKQPLAIVNYGGATAREIKDFADELVDVVKEKTGIAPEYEVSLVGEW